MSVFVEIPYEGELPEIVGSDWCAETFGITTAAVGAAIRDGRLPAERLRSVWVIKPKDALLLWGHRLRRAKETV
ncbi:MAG: hypothetical protein KDB26_15100 [Microthrixaceae bacterium]|nr:hypothetical protein [Microthrixaceae bacterium]